MTKESLGGQVQRLQGDLMRHLTGYRTLKSFIRELRVCETPSEEKALLLKELANLRTTLRDTLPSLPPTNSLVTDYRWQSMAKLLYIATLVPDASVSFGQSDAIRMMAGLRLRDKRLGYLAAERLLDWQQTALTLCTNTIKQDLCAQNDENVTTLALNAICTFVSPELAQNLSDDVFRMLSSENLKRDAAVSAGRLIRLDPDLISGSILRDALLMIDPPERKQFSATNLFTKGYPAEKVKTTVLKDSIRLAGVNLLSNLNAAGCEFEVDPEVLIKCIESKETFLQAHALRLARKNLKELPMHRLQALFADFADCSSLPVAAVAVELVVTCFCLTDLSQTVESLCVSTMKQLLGSPNPNIRYEALHSLSITKYNLTAFEEDVMRCLREEKHLLLQEEAFGLALKLVDDSNYDKFLPMLLEKTTNESMLSQLARTATQCTKKTESSSIDVEALLRGVSDVSLEEIPLDPNDWYLEFMTKLISRLKYIEEAILDPFCTEIKERKLLKTAIAKIYETKSVCAQRVLFWCLGEHYLFSQETDFINQYLDQIRSVAKENQLAFLICLAKLKRLDKAELVNIGEAKLLRHVMAEVLRADPGHNFFSTQPIVAS